MNDPNLGSAIAPSRDLPSGWEPGERAYPYWDAKIESMVYGHFDDPDGGQLMVSVSPMLFNDRILLSSSDSYPLQWIAGFCYDKGPAAALAAMAWNPVTAPRPMGYKRVAGDQRFPHLPDAGAYPNEHVGPRPRQGGRQ